MGFTFRKSIKVGKNTRINLSSKGGVGISTGVKGARVSVNKQGAKVYGGKGAVRYQKQIYSATKSNQSASTNNYNKSQEVVREKKPGKIKTFFKKFYKEVIIVVIGMMIGTGIGGAGKVAPSEYDSLKYKHEQATKSLEEKQLELADLIYKKEELKSVLE